VRSRVDDGSSIHELRSDSPTAGLSVPASTASAMNGYREKAWEAGFADFNTKPIGIAALRVQVRKYLNQ